MHLSSAWSTFVSWFDERKQLRQQLREAKATCKQLKKQHDTAREMALSFQKIADDEIRKRLDLGHDIKIRDSRIGVLESEVELLSQVIERDIQRVKSETARHAYQQTRMLDAGIEGESIEE